MLETPGIVVAAATAPPLVYAVLVSWLDPRRPRPCVALAALFLWGVAVATLVAAPLNDLLLAQLAGATDQTRGRALGAIAGAPLVEETLKAAGLVVLLLLRRDLLRTPRDGMVAGALIGFGFDLAENAQYLLLAAVQGGMPGLVRGVWVRGILGGLKHAVFTATIGAGLGWARAGSGPARLVVPLLAGLAALAQHAVWNAVASEAITRALCGAPAPDAACRTIPSEEALFVSVPLIVAFCVGPGLIALAMVARRGAGRQAGSGGC